MKFFTILGLIGIIPWITWEIFAYNKSPLAQNSVFSNAAMVGFVIAVISFAIVSFIVKWRWADWQVQRRRKGTSRKSDYAKSLTGGAFYIPPKKK